MFGQEPDPDEVEIAIAALGRMLSRLGYRGELTDAFDRSAAMSVPADLGPYTRVAAAAAEAEVISADAIALAQKESAAARARCLADGGCLIGSAAEAEYNRQVDSWQAVVDEAAGTAAQM